MDLAYCYRIEYVCCLDLMDILYGRWWGCGGMEVNLDSLVSSLVFIL